MRELVIATRGSQLALAQARAVADLLEGQGAEVRLVEVATTGDRDGNTPVAALTEVGAFVRAVQGEVLADRADLAVHSCKDLPVAGPSELVAFYPRRSSPWDVVVGTTVESMRAGARVGTGSPRRAAQLAGLRPDALAVEIRGNVDTRLVKVQRGDCDALILAQAGLRRLGLDGAITQVLDLHQMVPAPAQGALAVEARRDSAASEALALLDDEPTRLAVETERELLRLTGAGCRAALGAYATATDAGISATGFVSDERGSRVGWAQGEGPVDTALALRKELGL